MAAFVGLGLLRLWLSTVQDVYAMSQEYYDDRLYIDRALHILAGDWLGPYNLRTLVKGPFYSLWLALTSALGLPLLLAQHAVYIAASGILAWSLVPVLRHRALVLLTYTILLANPMSYSDPTTTRVLREGIYPAQTLIVVALAIALLTRLDRPARQLAAWSTTLGLAMGALWLTREEGIWIVPTMLLLLVGAVVGQLRRPGPDRPARLAALLLPLLLWPAAVTSVAWVNRWYYGVYGVVELHWPEFEAANRALYRAGAPGAEPFVPLPKAMRFRIYNVSPAFAELAPLLEGEVGEVWMSFSCHDGRICHDLGAGWFPWAMRHAVAVKGHHASAPAAAAYYRRLAAEVDAACADGRLTCGSSPLLRREHLRPLAIGLAHAAAYVARFADFQAVASPSYAAPEERKLYEAVTHERLTADLSEPSRPRGAIDRLKLGALAGTGRFFQWTTPVAALLATLLYMTAGASGLLRRRDVATWLVATALGGAVAARILLVTVVHVTLFPAIFVDYLSPAYPLLLAFIVVVLTAAWRARAHRARPEDRAHDDRLEPGEHCAPS